MSTREQIIDAALSVVRTQGVAALTLDEAARLAGISKGGVLYHFKSKEALIQGMVARLAGQCETLQQAHYDRLSPGPNRWARALVETSFDPAGPSTDPAGCALLAAVATNPGLMEPLEDTIDTAFRRLTADSEDPSMALLVALAMDGLWLHRLVNSPVMDETQRLSIREKAMELLGEGRVAAAPAVLAKSAR
ncbi:TetR/AcrR family transcriptional regulator [Dongia rigui]|uniref:TetR/AcrR family transcriptional regulator n=1 Tax=Dongia rigui TaxID=940149 RepID=A0ABU5E2J7_9PROT|nr:TetR/AcrR family transcriptional regulator [Dongia rigui]MDY0873425.1 TetR/AcrR family transcriptional regulator [Dongia rigui]